MVSDPIGRARRIAGGGVDPELPHPWAGKGGGSPRVVSDEQVATGMFPSRGSPGKLVEWIDEEFMNILCTGIRGGHPGGVNSRTEDKPVMIVDST